HLADARASHAAAGRVVLDQRAAALRRGVLRDEGRAPRADVGGGLLRVPPCLRAGPGKPVARGIRRGHRLRVVPGDPGAHPGPVLAGQARDPLPVVSSPIAPVNAPTRLARIDASSLPGEIGMVEAKPNRLLPFDPWHLILAPLAVSMLRPLGWRVVTSLEIPAQTLHLPPVLFRAPPLVGSSATTSRQSAV